MLYKTVKISKDYVYLFFVDYKLTNKIITGKEEDFLLKYDNKEIPLKIKGRFDKEYGQFIYIDDLYIAGNKAKMVSSGVESEQIIRPQGFSKPLRSNHLKNNNILSCI